MRVFVCVAEHLNFTRAGEALGVTPGAASLQIRALEDYLSRQLFRRNGRVVELTTEGAELLPRVQQALGDIERALAATRGDRSGGPLRVTMLASFLQSWLLPRLPRLRADHPRIDLQVHTSEAMVDLVRDDQHAAIRLGTGDWPGVTAEKLLEEWLVPVCTPELYSRYGPLQRRQDIARYPLVHSTSEPWTAWLLENKAMEDTTSPFTGTRVDDSAAIVRLAQQGLGLALARWSLAGDDVAAGRLVAASDKPLSFFRTYWLVQSKHGRSHPALAQFREWLKSEIAKFPRPPGI
ncbi:MAG TPA: LysR substrate-binding domain-containing protein [Gammaproteobacteria bacterium]|nr:LysR substrate-binding domain-containing protein [Gammaproteobacteria bacterium]